MEINNKDHYRQHCKLEPTIPIFSRDWWLDALCGKENWNVALVEKNGSIIGSLPYYKKKRLGFSLSTQPPLTQTLGPWIRVSNAKYAKVLGYQKDVMTKLIDQIPMFDYFSQNWHYNNTNWQPFYWKGFEQTTYYTYVLSIEKKEEQIWNGFDARVRTDIRKASKRFNLHVRDDLGIHSFLKLYNKTFERQGMKVPCCTELIERLDCQCKERSCRKILIAEDEEGRHHAGAYVVWDENSAYYLMGGGDPDLRASGATSLVIWEAIKHASTVTRKFDFEGSMVEPIERFFRGFGGKQELIFNISKTNSILLQLRKCLLSMVRKK